MQVDKRQKILLNTLVEDYIEKQEPLSSGYLLDKTQLKVSPATVRNDLLSLEKSGFVKNIHTA